MATTAKAEKNWDLEVLPPTISQPPVNRTANSRFLGPRLVVLLTVLGLGFYFTNTFNEGFDVRAIEWYRGHEESCSQPDILVPEKNGALWETLGGDYGTEEFKSRAVDWLAGAVRVPYVHIVSIYAIFSLIFWFVKGRNLLTVSVLLMKIRTGRCLIRSTVILLLLSLKCKCYSNWALEITLTSIIATRHSNSPK
jgi:hypothetical protein